MTYDFMLNVPYVPTRARSTARLKHTVIISSFPDTCVLDFVTVLSEAHAPSRAPWVMPLSSRKRSYCREEVCGDAWRYTVTFDDKRSNSVVQ